MTDQPTADLDDYTRLVSRVFDVPEHLLGSPRLEITAAIPDMRAWAAISVPLADETFELVDAFGFPALLSPNVKKILSLELELRDAKAEIARLRAGEADDPGDPDVAPSPAEWIRRWNDAPPAGRELIAMGVLSAFHLSQECFQLNHEGRIEDLTAHVRRLEKSAAADRRAHEAELEQLHRDAAAIGGGK